MRTRVTVREHFSTSPVTIPACCQRLLVFFFKLCHIGSSTLTSVSWSRPKYSKCFSVGMRFAAIFLLDVRDIRHLFGAVRSVCGLFSAPRRVFCLPLALVGKDHFELSV